ncbi:hypothetical protein QAD02_003286 [Eretmocerus hayati]|uniref:Uncharacterized protein n=1 Tax=Eretmocerus hayati TaxID=131215 RepID=A0ACC2NP61_9HYME|nr:hypothetical protein QAD02_003286 [Eretmocerus hayati]
MADADAICRAICDDEDLPQEILDAYDEALHGTLPAKSQVFTLWSKYSMIKEMLLVKKNVDISNYSNLVGWIKNKNVGYIRKQAKVFTPTHIRTFLSNASDQAYLHLKVAVIMGLCGATRREEQYNMMIKHVVDKGTYYVVTLYDRKSNKDRIFTVNEPYYQIVQKYIKLRPPNAKTESFFLTYRDGKCYNQAIGLNTIGSFPKQVAEYLQLDEPERYTGHSLRRTSTTILAGTGASMSTLKRHGGWKNPSCVEGYIEESEDVRQSICNQIVGAVDQTPSTSLSDQPSGPQQLKMSTGGNVVASNGAHQIVLNISLGK